MTLGSTDPASTSQLFYMVRFGDWGAKQDKILSHNDLATITSNRTLGDRAWRRGMRAWRPAVLPTTNAVPCSLRIRAWSPGVEAAIELAKPALVGS